MSMLQPGREKKRTLALLGSLCLFLSIIEYLIPKPLSFMRLGLANLPLLLALDILGPADFFFLALLKVLGQGIIGGTLFSYVFIFSVAGTFASAALMYALRKLLGKKYLGFAGLGCAGAMASNGTQLLLARYFIFGEALRYLIPPFLASGFITGIALGIFCEYFCRRSVWYAKHTESKILTTEYTESTEKKEVINKTPSPVEQSSSVSLRGLKFLSDKAPLARQRRSERWNLFFNADELFFCGLFMALIFLFGSSFYCRIAEFLFFCLLAWLSGKKNNIFVTSIIMAGIVFVNLLAPYGKVIAEIGPLRLTQGSLITGLEKAITLEALVMLSRACVSSTLRLPGTIGSLLGESLRLLEQMRENKNLIGHDHGRGRRRIFTGIDNLLLKMETTDDEEAMIGKPKRNVKSVLVLIAMILLTGAMGLIRINAFTFTHM
jgi:heptaprenyl diphosphate synthase